MVRVLVTQKPDSTLWGTLSVLTLNQSLVLGSGGRTTEGVRVGVCRDEVGLRGGSRPYRRRVEGQETG